MDEHELALKIADLCNETDEGRIAEIESLVLHFGHDEWQKGYSQCAEMVRKTIKNFGKIPETT